MNSFSLRPADVPVLWSGAGHPEWVRRGAGGAEWRIPGEDELLLLWLLLLLKWFESWFWWDSDIWWTQVFKQPWPGVMRTVYGNHQRFETTYFKKFPGYYVTGDGEARSFYFYKSFLPTSLDSHTTIIYFWCSPIILPSAYSFLYSLKEHTSPPSTTRAFI